MLKLGCLLLICATASGQLIREIALAGIGKSESVLVALNAKGAACDEPALLRTDRAGIASLDGIDQRCRSCAEKHLRVAVFSSENAAVYLDSGQVCEQSANGRLSIAMSQPTPVTVHVWYSAGFKLQAMDAVANANWILRRNLAGVQLMARFHERPKNFPEDPGRSPLCVAASSSREHYQPGELNIYFPWMPSETCGKLREGPGNTANIITIGGSLPDVLPPLGDMAHELGHAFGLQSIDDGDPSLSYPNGHTPPRAGSKPRGGAKENPNFVDGRPLFGGENAIWDQSDFLGDAYSLGQVFWMNFSEHSFLAQLRQQRNEIRQTLPCPRDCVPYSLDSPVDMRLQPGANQRPFVVVESCPKDFLSKPGLRFLQPVFTGFALFTGIRELDHSLDPIASLEGRPRYCRAKDLLDTLDDRYPQVCQAENQPVACGSKTRRRFRETWSSVLIDSVPEKVSRAAGLAAAEAFAARRLKGKTCEESDECRPYLVAARGVIEDLVRSGDFHKIRGKRILWVDEPGGHTLERKVFKFFGVEVTDSSTNDDALKELGRKEKFSLVISDFERLPREPSAAPVLIAKMQQNRFRVPVVIYSRCVPPAEGANAVKLNALVETDNPFELYKQALETLLKKKIAIPVPPEPARRDDPCPSRSASSRPGRGQPLV